MISTGSLPPTGLPKLSLREPLYRPSFEFANATQRFVIIDTMRISIQFIEKR